jgi:hypothetical protein
MQIFDILAVKDRHVDIGGFQFKMLICLFYLGCKISQWSHAENRWMRYMSVSEMILSSVTVLKLRVSETYSCLPVSVLVGSWTSSAEKPFEWFLEN